MKMRIFLMVVFIGFKAAFVWAQEAIVIKVEGAVEVKMDAASAWQTAEEGQLLEARSQVKTGRTGKVIIAFGEDRSNIITIEKNTETVIEQIKPGVVYLPKGRVFTIIRDLSQIQNFEVKTPTAIAGARGTGWVTEFNEGKTLISVFEDVVAVQSFDQSGREISQFDLREDFAAAIAGDGGHQEPEPVNEQSRQEWNQASREIIQNVEEFKSGPIGRKDPVKSGLPIPSKQTAQLLTAMKNAGTYSPQEIAAMEKLLLRNSDTLNPDEKFKIMEQMGQMGMLSSQEKGMMAEISRNQEMLKGLSPESRERYMRSLEEKYGVMRKGPDGSFLPPGSPVGTAAKDMMKPADAANQPVQHSPQEMMRREAMANKEAIDQMSPRERQAYFAEMEQKHGLAPSGFVMPPPKEPIQQTSGDFNNYMNQMRTGPAGPPPEGVYDYSADPYFGEFDRQWDTTGGTFVNKDPYYDPLKDTIDDRPPCSCACTGPDCGLNCRPVYCAPPPSN